MKIGSIIALMCFVIGTAGQFKIDQRFLPYHRVINGMRWSARLCANQTSQQLFLNNTREYLNLLEANQSYTAFFERNKQSISYIRNDTAETLLTTNCTEYFHRFEMAKQLDREAAKNYDKLIDDVMRHFRQILLEATGTQNMVEDIFQRPGR